MIARSAGVRAEAQSDFDTLVLGQHLGTASDRAGQDWIRAVQCQKSGKNFFSNTQLNKTCSMTGMPCSALWKIIPCRLLAQ